MVKRVRHTQHTSGKRCISWVGKLADTVAHRHQLVDDGAARHRALPADDPPLAVAPELLDTVVARIGKVNITPL